MVKTGGPAESSGISAGKKSMAAGPPGKNAFEK